MAINLWKLGTGKSAYSPLPTGFTNSTNLGMGDFVATIKARSASQARLHITSASLIDKSSVVTLSSTTKEFVLSFTSTRSQTFYLYDTDTKGDIIIDSIELVQKPLPKLTINGIDGFTSSKWTLHANAKVIDDTTLELNATAASQQSFLIIPCQPLQTYIVSGTNGVLAGHRLRVYDNISNSLLATVPETSQPFSFTTASNCTQLKVLAESTVPGKFTFTKPMLNLGTTPAPYSKKTGDKMVIPVPVKNLFDGSYVLGSLAANTNDISAPTQGQRTTNWIPCKPNTNYSISGSDRGIWQYKDSAGNRIAGPTGLNLIPSITTPSDAVFMRVYYSTDGSHTQVQIEQGTTATPYTPYAVQMNKKPLKYVPKKNLMPLPDAVRYNETGSGEPTKPNTVINGKLAVMNYSGAVVGKGVMVDVIPNKPYTLSMLVETNNEGKQGYLVIGYTSGSSEIQSNMVSGSYSKTFTPTQSKVHILFIASNPTSVLSPVLFSNIQLEEGTTQTPYEAYSLILPRAKTGLAFNGVTDYLQLPSMTMDSIEIDCLIDAVQPNNSFWHRLLDNNGNDTYYLIPDLSGFTAYGDLTVVKGGLPLGKRSKVTIKKNSSLFGSVRLFSNGSSDAIKGTLYKVTCYLAGQVVATYDFENPSNIVGDKVIPNAKNLIPSFEDARWSLHANSQVLGKDVLRLNATGGSQFSTVLLDVIPNSSYLINSTIGLIGAFSSDGATSLVTGIYVKVPTTFNVGNRSKILISVSNYGSGTGTFDFIHPSLYLLDGKEGTIVGSPTKLKKASKRTLYSKR